MKTFVTSKLNLIASGIVLLLITATATNAQKSEFNLAMEKQALEEIIINSKLFHSNWFEWSKSSRHSNESNTADAYISLITTEIYETEPALEEWMWTFDADIPANSMYYEEIATDEPLEIEPWMSTFFVVVEPDTLVEEEYPLEAWMTNPNAW